MVKRLPNMFAHTRNISSVSEAAAEPGTSWTSWTSRLTSSYPDSDTASTPPSDHGATVTAANPASNNNAEPETQELGGGIEALGKRRAMQMLFTVPDRFNRFCHINQPTFFELSDWILANVQSKVGMDISVEESLFVFLDVVAQGNSFDEVASYWDHDLKLTQSIFLNILSALHTLRSSQEPSDTCPSFLKTRKRWYIARRWTPSKMQPYDMIKIGYNERSRDGLDIEQQQIMQALEALNNFIHEHADHDGA